MLWGHLYYDESLIGDSVSVSLLIRLTATVLVGIYTNVLFESKNIYTHNFSWFYDVYEYESSVGQCSDQKILAVWWSPVIDCIDL